MMTRADNSSNSEATSIALNGFDDFFNHTLELAKEAQRQITICSPDMDRDIYGTSAFIETLLTLIKRSRQARIRILAVDTKQMVETGHPILRLLRYTDEQCQIKKYHVDPEVVTPAYFICDNHSMIRRQDATLYKGFCYRDDRARINNQQEEFDQRWASAMDDPNLRQLAL